MMNEKQRGQRSGNGSEVWAAGLKSGQQTGRYRPIVNLPGVLLDVAVGGRRAAPLAALRLTHEMKITVSST